MCNQGGDDIDQWRMGSLGKTRFQGKIKCHSVGFIIFIPFKISSCTLSLKLRVLTSTVHQMKDLCFVV